MLGTPVPLRLVLARTEEVVIAITRATAFPSGVDLDVVLRQRRARDDFDMPFEFARFGRRRERTASRTLPPELLRIGVQFSDGRKATSIGDFGFGDFDQAPEGPVLTQGRGGGGGGNWEFSFWLWPLPPPGPLAFVCEWPAEGIELTRVEIDAGVLIEAADQAEVLWDDVQGAGGAGGSYSVF